eukprot:scaffold127713_cov21-Tisochrysis_lutea.AAC.3
MHRAGGSTRPGHTQCEGGGRVGGVRACYRGGGGGTPCHLPNAAHCCCLPPGKRALRCGAARELGAWRRERLVMGALRAGQRVLCATLCASWIGRLGLGALRGERGWRGKEVWAEEEFPCCWVHLHPRVHQNCWHRRDLACSVCHQDLSLRFEARAVCGGIAAAAAAAGAGGACLVEEVLGRRLHRRHCWKKTCGGWSG